MIRLFMTKLHPLRVYIEGDKEDIYELVTYTKEKFSPDSEYTDEDTIDNIIFSDDGFAYFPKGLYSIIIGILNKLCINFEEDPSIDIGEAGTTFTGEIPEDILDGITLRPYQLDAVNSALINKRGIIQVSTGGGKTEIVLSIVKYLYQTQDNFKTYIICVPSTKLLYQTRDRAVKRGFDPEDISVFGDSNSLDVDRRLCISTVQTLVRRLDSEEYQDWYSRLGMIVMDEAHHCSARTFFTVLDTLHAEYMLGVTAEPFYGDKNHQVQDLIVRGSLGPILYQILVPQLVELGYLSKPYLLTFQTQSPRTSLYNSLNWKVVQKELLVENPLRNELISRISKGLIEIGKNPLILISQISHGKLLATKVSRYGYRVAMLTGGSHVEIYRDGVVIEEYTDPENKIFSEFTGGLVDALVGTSVLDEGADIPSLSSVVLAGGGKSPLKVVQRIGRGLRVKEGDNSTWIIDFIDAFNIVTRSHFKKRNSILSSLGMQTYQILNTDHVEETLKEFKKVLTNPATSL